MGDVFSEALASIRRNAQRLDASTRALSAPADGDWDDWATEEAKRYAVEKAEADALEAELHRKDWAKVVEVSQRNRRARGVPEE